MVTEEIDEDTLCVQSKILNFRLPFLNNKVKATEECKKYRQAIISKPPSPDMRNVTNMEFENIYGEKFLQCKFFWTPFTDKYSEGTFVNEITNETIRYNTQF